MAIRSGFYDAQYDASTEKYDRYYNSGDMAILYEMMAGNGVFRGYLGGLRVSENAASMSVKVASGGALIKGRYLQNTTNYQLPVDIGSAQDRIDSVVAKLDLATQARTITLEVKRGTPSSTPVAPPLTRNDTVWEIQLATIYLRANASGVTDDMITDTRKDEDVCGFCGAGGGGTGGGASIIDAYINPDATAASDRYKDYWLVDGKGSVITPESKCLYVVQSGGVYYHCMYSFDVEANEYYGVGSYDIEMSVAEMDDLIQATPASKLQFTPVAAAALEWTGTEQQPLWLFYDPTEVRISGEVAGTDVGVYRTQFQPQDGYAWSDGSTDVIVATWQITKKRVPKPVPVQTQVNYTGQQQQIEFDRLESQYVTITNGRAQNTGDYTALGNLKYPTNTTWEDGTTEQLAWPWEIIGAENVVVLDKYEASIAEEGGTVTVEVLSSTSGGAVSAVSDKPQFVVVQSVVGNVITLAAGEAAGTGTAQITITVAGTSTVSKGTVKVDVTKAYGMNIVSWADGTDEEIARMVDAADRGLIDLHDYWNVGDTRLVNMTEGLMHIYLHYTSGSNYTAQIFEDAEQYLINKQQVELVLADAGHYSLVDPTPGGRSLASFAVVTKDCVVTDVTLSGVIYVSSQITNNGIKQGYGIGSDADTSSGSLYVTNTNSACGAYINMKRDKAKSSSNYYWIRPEDRRAVLDIVGEYTPGQPKAITQEQYNRIYSLVKNYEQSNKSLVIWRMPLALQPIFKKFKFYCNSGSFNPLVYKDNATPHQYESGYSVHMLEDWVTIPSLCEMYGEELLDGKIIQGLLKYTAASGTSQGHSPETILFDMKAMCDNELSVNVPMEYYTVQANRQLHLGRGGARCAFATRTIMAPAIEQSYTPVGSGASTSKPYYVGAAVVKRDGTFELPVNDEYNHMQAYNAHNNNLPFPLAFAI